MYIIYSDIDYSVSIKKVIYNMKNWVIYTFFLHKILFFGLVCRAFFQCQFSFAIKRICIYLSLNYPSQLCLRQFPGE